MLRTVSVDALRRAGLLEAVLACAAPSGPEAAPGAAQEAAAAEDAGPRELAGMDLDALLDLALDEKR